MINNVTSLNTVTNAGGTVTFAPDDGKTLYIFTGTATLANDYSVTYSGSPSLATQVIIYWLANVATNGHTVTIFGQALTTVQATKNLQIVATFNPSGAFSVNVGGLNNQTGIINTADIADAAVTLAKLANLARGSLMVGGASNLVVATDFKTSGRIPVGDGTDLNSVAVSGVMTLSNAGVTAFAAGAIVNADINASAAIALSKLATLTASKAVTTTAGGSLQAANQISALLGGTGIDTSSSTGVATVAAGTWAVGARTETLVIQLSFETGYLGDYKVPFPFAATVTGMYAYAVKAIAGTDNGTIQLKNNGGTSMTNGLITFTASDVRGTAYTVSPSANNTLAAADFLTFTVAKATAGGAAQVTLTYTRTT